MVNIKNIRIGKKSKYGSYNIVVEYEDGTIKKRCFDEQLLESVLLGE